MVVGVMKRGLWERRGSRIGEVVVVSASSEDSKSSEGWCPPPTPTSSLLGSPIRSLSTPALPCCAATWAGVLPFSSCASTVLCGMIRRAAATFAVRAAACSAVSLAGTVVRLRSAPDRTKRRRTRSSDFRSDFRTVPFRSAARSTVRSVAVSLASPSSLP